MGGAGGGAIGGQGGQSGPAACCRPYFWLHLPAAPHPPSSASLATGQARRGAGGRGGGGADSEALEELRRENESIVSQLVSKKMELAELAQSEAQVRGELYRLKDVNYKLAAKMTSLEAQAYGGGRGGKKR